MRKKVPSSQKGNQKKVIPNAKNTTDNHHIVWRFEWRDMDGPFAFQLARKDFQHQEVLQKVIDYGNMTWAEIKKQTHDESKSKHHFLDMDGLSREAKERFDAKGFSGVYEDSLFSLALQNTLRIIGIRVNEYFYAVWYDPNHKFYPSKR